MLIYKDIVTGDEIISDTWELKEVDGIVYEAELKKVNKGGESFDIGANPSAEGGDDAVEDVVEQDYDVVIAFRLQERKYSPKERKAYYVPQVKAYMKKVVEALKAKGTDEATIKEFQTGAQKYVKKIISNIEDYDLYAGESQEPDGMLVLLNFREDGVTPYITIWKHGLTAMKV